MAHLRFAHIIGHPNTFPLLLNPFACEGNHEQEGLKHLIIHSGRTQPLPHQNNWSFSRRWIKAFIIR